MEIPFKFPNTYKMKHYDISFFTGTTGSGKSFGVKVLIKKYNRLIVWDSGKEYYIEGHDDKRRLTEQAEANFNGTRGMGNKLVKSPNHLKNLMYNAIREGEQYKKHRLIIRPVLVTDVALLEQYMAVIRDFIEEWGIGWFLVLEEVSDITNPHFTPPILQSMLRRHRHLELGIALVTQRPAGTSTWMKSQAKHVFIFQLTLINDLKAITEWIGQFIDSEGKKVIKAPISPVFLRPRNFILMNVRDISQVFVIDSIRRLIPTGEVADIPNQELVEKDRRQTTLQATSRRVKEFLKGDDD